MGPAVSRRGVAVGNGQGCGGSCGRHRFVVGCGWRHHREVGGRAAASTGSSMGVGIRRWVGSLMGCAVRGERTSVGDGGDVVMGL